MKQGGMSLIELLVVISILGVFISFGLPAFRDYQDNNKIRSAADSITSGLHRARMEAIMRNNPVQFIPNGTSWQMVLPAVGNTPAQVIAVSEAVQFGANIATNASAANITFTGRGRTSAGANYTIDISSPGSGNCAVAGGQIRCLRVQVTPTGRVKLCDPALAAADPRAC